MMNVEDAIVIYEDVAHISAQMLQAARKGEWDDLVSLEKTCASRVKTLAANEAPLQYQGGLRQRKLSLLRSILADDREIRDLTEPWLKELGQLMQRNRTERQLATAYGGQLG